MEEVKQMASDFMEGQQHYYAKLRLQRQDLNRFQASRAEHLAAVQLLNELPKKTRHSIMVPLGPMAFMPGELVHTNEVLVLLGDNYFAEQSATQAVAIMQRRIGVIDTIISKTETNIKDLTARNNFSDEARKALLRKLDSGAEPPEVPADLQQRAEEDDDEEGLGQEFWSAAGFVGTFANDYHSDLDDSDSDAEGEEHAAPTGEHHDEEWNDDDPVLEICEPIDGGETGVLKHWHSSQRAFEESEACNGYLGIKGTDSTGRKQEHKRDYRREGGGHK